MALPEDISFCSAASRFEAAAMLAIVVVLLLAAVTWNSEVIDVIRYRPG